jgi:hypothetical protein
MQPSQTVMQPTHLRRFSFLTGQAKLYARLSAAAMKATEDRASDDKHENNNGEQADKTCGARFLVPPLTLSRHAPIESARSGGLDDFNRAPRARHVRFETLQFYWPMQPSQAP